MTNKIGFQDILKILTPITYLDNNSDGNFTKDKKKHVSKLGYMEIMKFLELLNGQSNVKKIEYSIYKQSYNDLDFNLVTMIFDNIDKTSFHTTFDISDKHILFNCLTPYCLSKYINQNSKLRYVYIPLTYACDIKDSGHIAFIMFDNKDKKVYLLDPNGSPGYFNNILDVNISFYIENMISKYINELKKFNMEYKYIYSENWNNNKNIINKSFENDFIGSGHCVAFSLMISHLMTRFEIEPSELYKILSNLSDDEKLYLFKQYTLGLFNISKMIK